MTAKRDTGPARLPALPPVNIQDPALRNWINAVAERLEVREGSRGNPFERAVTLREIADLKDAVKVLREEKTPGPGEVVIELGGGLTASVAIDKFVEAIKNTRLFRDLIKRLDDPTRFDDIVLEVREILLQNLAEEAAKRGADIRRMETKIQDVNRSLAMAVNEITASLQANAAGLREVSYAYANNSAAQAGKITQLIASLGNYYQDGQPGRAVLEQQMGVFADRINGLRAQYTLKVQAGGALAGFGLAAEEVNGVPSSAFIIQADKFAVVSPNYSGGLTNNPDANHVPFGVDANGIYLNNNVYVRGTMRVDAGGKTLADGLRGSLQVSASGASWSDTTARQAIWQALGRSGSAPNNNHLVIGDTVTISSGGNPPSYIETRYWTGSAWANPGVVINGNMLVDGSLAAQKIDTRGLEIKDASGNVILSAGVPLSASRVSGLGSLAYRNGVLWDEVSNKPAFGSLAFQNYVGWDGVSNKPYFGAFASLDQLTAANIGTYIQSAAIGTAYIQNAAITNAKIADASVGTLKIQGNAVTVPAVSTSFSIIEGNGTDRPVVSASIYLDQPGYVYASCSAFVDYGSGWRLVTTYLKINNTVVSTGGGAEAWTNASHSGSIYVAYPGTVTATLYFNGQPGCRIQTGATIFLMAAKR